MQEGLQDDRMCPIPELTARYRLLREAADHPRKTLRSLQGTRVIMANHDSLRVAGKLAY